MGQNNQASSKVSKKHDKVEITTTLNGCNLHADQVLFGSGSISKAEGSFSKEVNAETDYKDLIIMLNLEAEKNCRIDNAICCNRIVGVVPLQITNNVEQKIDGFHFHHREERAELLSKPPVGDVEIEELFVKAKEHVEYESGKVDFGNQRAKENFVQVHSNVVGILGQAGCGKSTLAKIILNRIVGDEHLYQMNLVFYFQFCNVNYENKTINFLKFLSPSLTLEWMDDKLRRNKGLTQLQNSENLIIIMDGLDETKINFTRNHEKVSIYDETTAELFIVNILNGAILPKAKKIIFSRPRQMFELPDVYRPRFLVNILGLDKKSQMQICQDICGENKDQVYSYIENHPNILSFSYIPINCILTCFAINEIMSQDSNNVPHSMTGILTFVLASFVDSESHHGKFEAKNITELAWLGFKDKKITFRKKDLIISKLTDLDIDNLFVVVAKERKLRMFGGNPQVILYFSHLMLQEFLVAVHLLYFIPLKEFQDLFFSDRPVYHLSNSRFEMVTKFLFGLCYEGAFENLKECIPSCLLCPKKLELLQMLPKDVTYKTINDDVLRYFNWAYELQNDGFTNRLASRLCDEVEIECQMLSSDFAAFYYVCNKRQPITLHRLSFHNFLGKCWEGFVSHPQFSASIKKIQIFSLNANSIGDKGATVLAKFIHLLDEVFIGHCDITHVGINSIADELVKSNHQIKLLVLTKNKIGDKGAVVLSKCIHLIDKIYMKGCDVTKIGVESIATALVKSNHQIKSLAVSHNKIGDEGAIALSKCIHLVDKIDIEICNVTKVGLESMAQALMQSNHQMKLLKATIEDASNETTNEIAAGFLSNVRTLILNHKSYVQHESGV